MAIGAAFGAVVSFGLTIYEDYTDDGEIFNGSISTKEYIGNTLGGFVAGAGIGACTVLGAAAGTAMLLNTSATLFGASGITVTMGSAISIGTSTAFLTGMAGYSIRAGFSEKESFNVRDMFLEGGFNALSGLLSVCGGYLGGISGLRIDMASKLLSKKSDVAFRLIIENYFTGGIKIGAGALKGVLK